MTDEPADEPDSDLVYWRDGPWYVGRLADEPGVFSQGRTLDELRANVRDATEMMVA